MMIQFNSLPFPPTMNHRVIPCRGRLVLSPEYRSYKKTLQATLKNIPLPDGYLSTLAEKPLRIGIEYYGSREQWFTKKGAIKKKDVDNRHKALIDGVFSFLELDDSQVFEINIKKVVGGSELTACVKIEEVV